MKDITCPFADAIPITQGFWELYHRDGRNACHGDRVETSGYAPARTRTLVGGFPPTQRDALGKILLNDGRVHDTTFWGLEWRRLGVPRNAH